MGSHSLQECLVCNKRTWTYLNHGQSCQCTHLPDKQATRRSVSLYQVNGSLIRDSWSLWNWRLTYRFYFTKLGLLKGAALESPLMHILNDRGCIFPLLKDISFSHMMIDRIKLTSKTLLLHLKHTNMNWREKLVRLPREISEGSQRQWANFIQKSPI